MNNTAKDSKQDVIDIKVEAQGDTFSISISRNGNAWWGIPVAFPTKQAAQNAAQAILDNAKA